MQGSPSSKKKRPQEADDHSHQELTKTYRGPGDREQDGYVVLVVSIKWQIVAYLLFTLYRNQEKMKEMKARRGKRNLNLKVECKYSSIVCRIFATEP